MEELEDEIYWLLDYMHKSQMRTYNAVVDAIHDLRTDNVDDASSAEIEEVLQRYADPGVNVDLAHEVIERFYSRLFDLGISIKHVMQTGRGAAPYVTQKQIQHFSTN